MKTIEELEAELETVTRERDKFQVLAELGDGYRSERDEARAEVERLTREPAVHPSNLTDVVSLLEDERDELLVRVANQEAELRATREAYIDAKWTNAYRRGAEAMREACARVADAHCVPGTRDVIRAMPISEET